MPSAIEQHTVNDDVRRPTGNDMTESTNQIMNPSNFNRWIIRLHCPHMPGFAVPTAPSLGLRDRFTHHFDERPFLDALEYPLFAKQIFEFVLGNLYTHTTRQGAPHDLERRGPI